MSLDGLPFTAKTLNGNVSSKALPSSHYSIGSDDSQSYFLDEFKIYSRKLTDDEIKKIWIKNQNKCRKGNEKYF
jgi:hypothetical protein